MTQNISYEELSYFLGSRCLSDSLKNRLTDLEKNIDKILYRGLSFPKQLLKVGCIIEEWYGSSHWTPDINVAIDFSLDYINEDYIEELQEELGVEVNVVQVVLWSKDIKGIEVYKIIEALDKTDFLDEKEVTVIGYNFEIINIHFDSGIYFVEVAPIKIV